MVRRVHRLLLKLYRRLPVLPRRWIVRAIAPKYTVGAMCIIERADGEVLLVRHSYRKQWGTPGGLLRRGEDPAEAARREVFEEVGLAIDLLGEPAVVVDAEAQRIDIVYRAAPSVPADSDAIRPGSVEITEARWFPADRLPELQFETTGALMALARSARWPQAPVLRAADDLRHARGAREA
jgi:8-oxo-dGTP pyrophosphatase MutT (NUDIX family)